MERISLDKKLQQKEKINNSLNNNSHNEKNHSCGNNISKNNKKLLTNRTNLINNKKPSTIYSFNKSNGINIINKSLREPSIKKLENNINKVIITNSNLM